MNGQVAGVILCPNGLTVRIVSTEAGEELGLELGKHDAGTLRIPARETRALRILLELGARG